MKVHNILILGGGYSAYGNQISLESNVKYFQRIKPILQLEENISHTIILRDGNDLRARHSVF